MIYEMKEAYIECCKKILEGISKDENLDFKRSLPICILDAVFSIELDILPPEMFGKGI